MKKSHRKQCYCKPQSYEYEGNEMILTGTKGKENLFEVKRIIVFEME